MNEENSKTLTEKFPKLYKGIFEERKRYSKGEPFGPIAFGFECGDGWFKLIYDLSEKIEVLINALPENEQSGIYASQVKEKFGTLRFYMSGATDEIYDLITEAEIKSGEVCETCSEPSIPLGSGWIVNQCRSCYIKYVAERRDRKDAIEAGAFWDAAKKRQDTRAKAIIRLNKMRAKKGLEKSPYC